jgi:hypothetical protein
MTALAVIIFCQKYGGLSTLPGRLEKAKEVTQIYKGQHQNSLPSAIGFG